MLPVSSLALPERSEPMWEQPPQPALSGAERTVQSSEARRHYGVAAFSNSAFRCTLLPPLTFSFRSQSLNPAFFTVTV